MKEIDDTFVPVNKFESLLTPPKLTKVRGTLTSFSLVNLFLFSSTKTMALKLAESQKTFSSILTSP